MYLDFFDSFEEFFEECKLHKQAIEGLNKEVKKELRK